MGGVWMDGMNIREVFIACLVITLLQMLFQLRYLLYTVLTYFYSNSLYKPCPPPSGTTPLGSPSATNHETSSPLDNNGQSLHDVPSIPTFQLSNFPTFQHALFSQAYCIITPFKSHMVLHATEAISPMVLLVAEDEAKIDRTYMFPSPTNKIKLSTIMCIHHPVPFKVCRHKQHKQHKQHKYRVAKLDWTQLKQHKFIQVHLIIQDHARQPSQLNFINIPFD